MRILGVDPGTWRTGVGLIESRGSRYEFVHASLIELKGEPPLSERLLRIHQSLVAIIQEFRPDMIALENVFFGKDVQAMVKIGEARACAMLAAAGQGLQVLEYAPARVKQSVTGNGRATKEQMQRMVKMLLNLRDLPQNDTADALAVAICHLHTYKTEDRRLKTKDLSKMQKSSVFGL